MKQVESDKIVLTSGVKVKKNDENLKPISQFSGQQAHNNGRPFFVFLVRQTFFKVDFSIQPSTRS